MKSLATQFDTGRRASAVATPTCSSCCCCCCCLATITTTSTMLSQKVADQGRREGVPHYRLYSTLAALFWPILVGMLLVENQVVSVVNPYGWLGGILPTGVVTGWLALWFLFSRVGVRASAGQAAVASVIMYGALVTEVFGVVWATGYISDHTSSNSNSTPSIAAGYLILAVFCAIVAGGLYGRHLRAWNRRHAETVTVVDPHPGTIPPPGGTFLPDRDPR